MGPVHEEHPPSYGELLRFASTLRDMTRRVQEMETFKTHDMELKLALVGLLSASAHLLEELLVH